jgi:hypothetical protein
MDPSAGTRRQPPFRIDIPDTDVLQRADKPAGHAATQLDISMAKTLVNRMASPR